MRSIPLSRLPKPNISKFVEANRPEIDHRILTLSPDFKNITDEDRALWILTIEELMYWAKDQGLRI